MTIGVNNIDFHSAGGKNESLNNISSRKNAESGNFNNAGRKALEDYGKKYKK